MYCEASCCTDFFNLLSLSLFKVQKSSSAFCFHVPQSMGESRCTHLESNGSSATVLTIEFVVNPSLILVKLSLDKDSSPDPIQNV